MSACGGVAAAPGVLSIDAWRRPEIQTDGFPAWYTYLLRFQFGVVYVFAGLAKLGSDWLLGAQPLSIWLAPQTDLPLIGPVLGERWAWFAFSWAGFIYDSTIVIWLSWPRTRLWAYAFVVGFHATTKALFAIGMFPLIMTGGTDVLFPHWPRRLWTYVRGWVFPRMRRAEVAPPAAGTPVAKYQTANWRIANWKLALLATFVVFQVAFPLRHHLYGGNVLWHEQGVRFSWRVMVREKTASITYLVSHEKLPRTQHVGPERYLSSVQVAEMAGRPEMILQLAHHVAQDFAQRGYPNAQVRVDAKASLNGRSAKRIVDPSVNLAAISEGFGKADWILPAPTAPPFRQHALP